MTNLIRFYLDLRFALFVLRFAHSVRNLLRRPLSKSTGLLHTGLLHIGLLFVLRFACSAAQSLRDHYRKPQAFFLFSALLTLFAICSADRYRKPQAFFIPDFFIQVFLSKRRYDSLGGCDGYRPVVLSCSRKRVGSALSYRWDWWPHR